MKSFVAIARPMSKKENLSFRPAVAEDRSLIFEWRNYPEIVELSASKLPVAWEEHLVWFSNFLADPERLLLIIEDDSRPIGQARFDKVANDTLIMGIYLIPSMVGQGRGKSLIEAACSYAKAKWPNSNYIKAEIRKENIRSRRAFAAAGFKLDSTDPQRKSKDVDSMIHEC